MVLTSLTVVTIVVVLNASAGAAAGSASQRLASLGVSMKVHCLSDSKAAIVLSCWSPAGGVGAQPDHCGLVRQTTQAGLHSAPGTQTQPASSSCAQRP